MVKVFVTNYKEGKNGSSVQESQLVENGKTTYITANGACCAIASYDVFGDTDIEAETSGYFVVLESIDVEVNKNLESGCLPISKWRDEVNLSSERIVELMPFIKETISLYLEKQGVSASPNADNFWDSWGVF